MMMTYQELIDRLTHLSPAHLAQPVEVSCADRPGCHATGLFVAAEDWILNDDGDDCQPRSEIAKQDPGHAAKALARIPAGTVQILVA